MTRFPRGFAMFSLAALAADLGVAHAQAGPLAPAVVPPPKEIELTNYSWGFAGTIVILIERDADPIIRYAAESLQTSLARRCGMESRIVAGDASDAKGAFQFILGEAGDDRLVSLVCERAGIKLSLDGVGFDGYVIQTPEVGEHDFVAVAGSNARAVFYGQDTLSQLVLPGARRGRMTVRQMTVRD